MQAAADGLSLTPAIPVQDTCPIVPSKRKGNPKAPAKLSSCNHYRHVSAAVNSYLNAACRVLQQSWPYWYGLSTPSTNRQVPYVIIASSCHLPPSTTTTVVSHTRCKPLSPPAVSFLTYYCVLQLPRVLIH